MICVISDIFPQRSLAWTCQFLLFLLAGKGSVRSSLRVEVLPHQPRWLCGTENTYIRQMSIFETMHFLVSLLYHLGLSPNTDSKIIIKSSNNFNTFCHASYRAEYFGYIISFGSHTDLIRQSPYILFTGEGTKAQEG